MIRHDNQLSFTGKPMQTTLQRYLLEAGNSGTRFMNGMQINSTASSARIIRISFVSLSTPINDRSHHADILPRQPSAGNSRAAFIAQSYGSVLAPLPTSGTQVQGNLSRALCSVAGVACLRAEERVGPQLTSHVFGLLRARYTEDQSPRDAWISSDEGVEWVICTVDKTVDGVTSEQEAPQSRVKL
jgi:hypothetical protein